jgi:hypothetical protein
MLFATRWPVPKKNIRSRAKGLVDLSRRAQLCPVLGGIIHECEHVRLGVVEECRELREVSARLIA